MVFDSLIFLSSDRTSFATIPNRPHIRLFYRTFIHDNLFKNV